MDVVLTGPAQKQISALPSNLRLRVLQKIAALKLRPFSGKKLQGDLGGRYAIRIWPLRVIYRVSGKTGPVIVLRVADRKDAYR